MYLVHIGKCGGGTVRKELKKNNIEFEVVHCSKPKILENYKYIILIRDPINRFISAFNWKMFRRLDQGHKECKNSDEIEGFKYWKNINNLAEKMYNSKGNIRKSASKLIDSCNHLQKDINFYLDDLLNHCNKNNCKVIRYEYFKEDISKVLGIHSVESNVHVYNKYYSKYLSRKGLKNLKKFLKKDYDCFNKLRDLHLIDDDYHKKILSGEFQWPWPLC